MTSIDTDKFLHAEQSAIEIVDQLEKLREETISYKSATQEIDQARESLENLANQLTELTRGTVELIQKTNEIGIEGIQSKLSDIQRLEQDQNDQLRKSQQEVTAKVKQLYSDSNSIYKDQGQMVIKALGENSTKLQGLLSKFELYTEGLKEYIASYSKTQEEQITELCEKLNEMDKKLKNLEKSNSKSFVLLLILIVVVLVLKFI